MPSRRKRVHAGEEIIPAQSGKPYARLVPIREVPIVGRLGRLLCRVGDDIFEPFPEDELILPSTYIIHLLAALRTPI